MMRPENAVVARQSVLEAVYAAVDQTNEALESGGKLVAREDQIIIGEGASLDSLGFVSLMVSVESEMSRRHGSCPMLTEEIGDPDVHVSTLGELADFIAERL